MGECSRSHGPLGQGGRHAGARAGAGSNTPAAPDTPAPSAPPRATIADVIQVYLANREAMVAYPTFRKHRTFTKQLEAFATSRGYVMLDQFRPMDIDVVYATSTLGRRAKGRMLEKLRGFFRFAVNRELISKSPVSPDLKPAGGRIAAGQQQDALHGRAARGHHQGV